jgi:tetratricopeptide (TPR) repeat protein
MKNSKEISECITDLEFENYIKDNLANSEKNRIEQHCSFCEMCNDSLEGLLMLEKNKLFESQKAKLILAEGGKKINMWVYFSAAASLFIVLGISFLFLNKSEKIEISSNEVKLKETNSLKTEASKSPINSENTAESVDQTISEVESKVAQEKYKQAEANEIATNKTITKIALRKSEKRKEESYAPPQPTKNLQLPKETLPVTKNAAEEDLASTENAAKFEQSLDDAKSTSVENIKSKGVILTESTKITSDNFLSNKSASGASPSAPSYTSPSTFRAMERDNTNSTLNEIQVVSTSKKRMQKTDSRINERESELVKIKAAENFITQKSYDKAIGQLERVIKNKSNSEYYNKALWLKANCLKNLNKPIEANKILNELISKNSTYSKIATDSLKEWSK